MPDRQAVEALLRHAAACYGEDLPVPCDIEAAAARSAASPPAVAAAEPVARADSAPAESAPKEASSAETKPDAAAAGAPDGDSATALSALRDEVLPCTSCKLHADRTNLVFGEGSPTARVMFIGEAPGRVEDQTGRPFVGPSGQLLEKIIENAMGMKRKDVFIANINKCRPPGNRDPEPDEIAACLPHLRRQVALIRPEVIVTLGRVALCNLLGVDQPMRVMRGQTLSYEGTPVVPTWHPAYLLRTPSAKRDTWDDIKRVNVLLGLPEVPTRPGT